MGSGPGELPPLLVESREEWRRWLEAHHASSAGVWLVRWKKGSGHPHVGYDEVVEEALCFGWVDSLPRSLDEERSQLRLTPRKPTSRWSAANRARVERLRAAGRMAPAGEAAVAAAVARGTWDALDPVESLEEPPDLARALDDVPEARRHWDAFPPSTRRAVLEWLLSARTEATRSARVARTVAEAAENRRANQWRQPKGR